MVNGGWWMVDGEVYFLNRPPVKVKTSSLLVLCAVLTQFALREPQRDLGR